MIKRAQTNLFPIDNPLRNEEWEAVFKKIPNKPGVYWFLDGKCRVLYVGKAKNLRKRLNSYRFSKTIKSSSKLIHLVSLAKSICWKVLPSEYHALLEEDRLIKYYVPVFNKVNANFEQYYYIHLIKTEHPLKWNITLSMHHNLKGSSYVFGAYKGHKTFRMALGSLIRILFFLTLPKSRPKTIPVVLLRKLSPSSYTIFLRPYTFNRLKAFLQGKYFSLLKEFEHKVEQMIRHLPKADAMLLEDDYARLYSFYFRNCKPLYKNTNEKAFTHKNQLDTRLIKWSNRLKD